MPDLPEEAVEAHAQILFGRMMRERSQSTIWGDISEAQKDGWRRWAQADVTAIRKQERERVLSRLAKEFDRLKEEATLTHGERFLREAFSKAARVCRQWSSENSDA